ncbi:MAG: class III poly(R)-hydroxyalkanoic acid synthase subunit PhaE [Xanthomonadaceae bacterium]|nr:class III poly(R)-hydroxyalkanoic acid synthase subunit PhaE [Xanthomonadaceae bacterium]
MATTDDFTALARQYWGVWEDALRGAAPAAGGDAMHGLRGMLDGWLPQANPQVGGQNGMGHVLEHFKRQSRDWLAQMQQVATQFAGRDHNASDVATAWRDAFGDSHPFAGLLEGMRGPGLENFMQWSETTAPWLAGMRNEAMKSLSVPAFGFTREHQERLQALGKAQLRQQAAQDAYGQLLAKISKQAFAIFESKLAEREEPGRQLGSVRALFDLWVDAAEDAWAQAALTTEYRRAFGELANAQMQLRGAAQAIGEQTATLLGLPGRTELDSAHRKIAELERQLRRLQRTAEAPAAAAPPASVSAIPAKKSAVRPMPAKPAPAASVKSAPAKRAKPAKVAKPAARKTAGKAVPRTAVKTAKPAARKR